MTNLDLHPQVLHCVSFLMGANVLFVRLIRYSVNFLRGKCNYELKIEWGEIGGSNGLVGGLLSLLITLFMFGGGNVANHYYLRLLLWLTKDLPADLIRFLEFSVDRVFLHRVGGGYLFIHQFLQAFFAKNETG